MIALTQSLHPIIYPLILGAIAGISIGLLITIN